MAGMGLLPIFTVVCRRMLVGLEGRFIQCYELMSHDYFVYSHTTYAVSVM